MRVLGSQRPAAGATQMASLGGQRVAPHAPAHAARAAAVPRITADATASTASTSVRLPATHVAASEQALQALAATKGVNRE
jgi:hypothetical protein